VALLRGEKLDVPLPPGRPAADPVDPVEPEIDPVPVPAVQRLVCPVVEEGRVDFGDPPAGLLLGEPEFGQVEPDVGGIG